MRYYLLILTAFALVTLSCKKEKSPLVEALKYNSGSSSAAINGNPFVSSVIIAKRSNDLKKINVNMSVYIDGFERQSMGLYNIKPMVGIQRLMSSRIWISGDIYRGRNDDSCSATFNLSHDDVGENEYYVWEDASNNMLEIETYDEAKSLLKGKFSVTFYRAFTSRRPQTQGFADTLRITDGKFEVTIK